jgi:trehalose 6-phosphate synthase/phosphatase
MITELKQEKEMIWIHDNYLLLVPTYVRRSDLNANIGFFMHCPFPSSDIYKMFPYRGEVLKSLLLCDLIGFHLFEYARNFYTACRRILGHNHEFKKGGFLGIECFGRNVMIRISHIGVQEDDIDECRQKPEYDKFLKHLTTVTGKRKNIIASIDRCHPISGLKNKLLAYQKFLRDFPLYRS